MREAMSMQKLLDQIVEQLPATYEDPVAYEDPADAGVGCGGRRGVLELAPHRLREFSTRACRGKYELAGKETDGEDDRNHDGCPNR